MQGEPATTDPACSDSAGRTGNLSDGEWEYGTDEVVSPKASNQPVLPIHSTQHSGLTVPTARLSRQQVRERQIKAAALDVSMESDEESVDQPTGIQMTRFLLDDVFRDRVVRLSMLARDMCDTIIRRQYLGEHFDQIHPLPRMGSRSVLHSSTSTPALRSGYRITTYFHQGFVYVSCMGTLSRIDPTTFETINVVVLSAIIVDLCFIGDYIYIYDGKTCERYNNCNYTLPLSSDTPIGQYTAQFATSVAYQDCSKMVVAKLLVDRNSNLLVALHPLVAPVSARILRTQIALYDYNGNILRRLDDIYMSDAIVLHDNTLLILREDGDRKKTFMRRISLDGQVIAASVDADRYDDWLFSKETAFRKLRDDLTSHTSPTSDHIDIRPAINVGYQVPRHAIRNPRLASAATGRGDWYCGDVFDEPNEDHTFTSTAARIDGSRIPVEYNQEISINPRTIDQSRDIIDAMRDVGILGPTSTDIRGTASAGTRELINPALPAIYRAMPLSAANEAPQPLTEIEKQDLMATIAAPFVHLVPLLPTMSNIKQMLLIEGNRLLVVTLECITILDLVSWTAIATLSHPAHKASYSFNKPSSFSITIDNQGRLWSAVPNGYVCYATE